MPDARRIDGPDCHGPDVGEDAWGVPELRRTSRVMLQTKTSGPERTASMDAQTIGMVFGGATVCTFAAFWLHGRLAGTSGRPGAASMFAFVLGWLGALTALLTGLFLLVLALRP
jgi:hypothetical protein